jgi:proline iminopeptidase
MRTFLFLILLIYCSKLSACQEIKSEWTFLTADKSEIYVVEYGNKDHEPIVFLHGGWGAEHSYMVSPFSYLCSKYRLIFFDMRGSLRSKKYHGENIQQITLSTIMSDLKQLQDEIGSKRIHIVAHSMGTFLAMNHLERYPDSIGKLVLIAPVPFNASLEQLGNVVGEGIQRCNRKEVLAELKKLKIEPILNCELYKIKTARDRGLAHSITQAGINLFNVNKWRELEGAFFYEQNVANLVMPTMPATWNFDEALSSKSKDIYVIHGADDYVPIQWSIASQKTIKHNLHIVKDAGHIVWVDQPVEVKSIMSSILEEKQ